jgi:peptide/nickel transport system ATP-binding protein
MKLLDIGHLYVEIGAPILRGVSIKIGPGEIHGLVGESGAGKTMVGKCVLGLLPQSARITHGFVEFEGRELMTLSPDARREILGRDITLIPQNPMTALNPVKRIEAQMTDVMRLHLDLPAPEASIRALELLQQVHIREPERVLMQYPHELSGGMRQRVLIATAFACKPKLVIADEPTTALDVTVQRQILRLIKELQQSCGTAILFITHDLGVVAKICDRVSVMHSGRILESQASVDLFARPAHPYTRALLAATPRFDRPGDALRPVPAELTEQLAQDIAAHDAARIG